MTYPLHVQFWCKHQGSTKTKEKILLIGKEAINENNLLDCYIFIILLVRFGCESWELLSYSNHERVKCMLIMSWSFIIITDDYQIFTSFVFNFSWVRCRINGTTKEGWIARNLKIKMIRHSYIKYNTQAQIVIQNANRIFNVV